MRRHNALVTGYGQIGSALTFTLALDIGGNGVVVRYLPKSESEVDRLGRAFDEFCNGERGALPVCFDGVNVTGLG